MIDDQWSMILNRQIQSKALCFLSCFSKSILLQIFINTTFRLQIKYCISVAKNYKYTLNDSFQGSSAIHDNGRKLSQPVFNKPKNYDDFLWTFHLCCIVLGEPWWHCTCEEDVLLWWEHKLQKRVFAHRPTAISIPIPIPIPRLAMVILNLWKKTTYFWPKTGPLPYYFLC